MAFIPTPFVARVAVEQRLDSQEIINTLWFSRFEEFNAATLQELAEAVTGAWSTYIMPNLAAQLTLEAVTAVSQASETAGSYTNVVNPPVAGGDADESEPNSTAACVTFLTIERGRGGRGRNFLAGVPDNAVALNTLTSGFMADIITAYENLAADLGALSYVHCIVSFSRQGAPTFVIGEAKTVIGYRFADNIIDNQRRRKPGVGS